MILTTMTGNTLKVGHRPADVNNYYKQIFLFFIKCTYVVFIIIPKESNIQSINYKNRAHPWDFGIVFTFVVSSTESRID